MKTCQKLFMIAFVLLFAFVAPLLGYAAEQREGMSASDAKKPPSEAMKIIEKMKFEPLKFSVPKVGKDVERVQLKNGMILYLCEDHRFPVVSIGGIIRTGSAYEKKERYGVARITGEVMRTGGTTTMSPDALNRELEHIATTLETSIGGESGSIHLNVIVSQLDTGMKLFADVLRHPAFNEKEIELAKSAIREELIRRNDNYREIGAREYYKILYPTYVTGWDYDWNFVKTIKKADLQAWHKRFYAPNNMMFAVVGDFKKADMIKRFETLFGDWKPEKVDFSGLQTAQAEFYSGVYFVKKDVDQSYIRMGHLGVTRGNPDRYALEVMNFILGGGGFNSWMTEKVRSDEGLAYSVGSSLALNSRVPGPFNAASSTRSNATVKALLLMRDQIERIRKDKVRPDELEWAKNSIINSFVFDFDEPSKQVSNLMMLEYDNRPRDYYETYTENIRKVTIDDVLRVAQKYLHPDKMTIFVVGNPAQFDKPLSDIAPNPKEIILTDTMKEEKEK